MSNNVNVEIISARPEDADFIAWIVAQDKKHNKSSEFHSVLILDIGVLNLVCQLMMEGLLCIVFGHFY